MKKKITGNFLRMLIFCGAGLCADPEFTVRVLDAQKGVIEQVAAGQPFMIEVAVADAPRGMSQPVIADIAQYNGYCSGVQMTTINGNSNSVYTYVLRIDSPGTYRIGPISTVYNGKKKELDSVSILVSTETRQNQTAAKMVNAAKAHYSTYLQLSMEKERVYVGEPVSVRLKFLYNSPHITLRTINEPVLTSVNIDAVSGPITGKQTLNGIAHEYIEWTWRLYPAKEGIVTIPAYSAQYEIVNQNTSRQAGMNFFMFFQPSPTKVIYSNAATLLVDPLPQYDGEPVSAVGRFNSFRAEVNPAMIKIGQAAVVTFALEGDAHFPTISLPILQNMPEGLRWYESKQWIEQKDVETRVKYFEYVLHACKSGDWEIPAQRFTFFDPEMNQCKQIESNSQYITVVSDTTGNETDVQGSIQQQRAAEENIAIENAPDISEKSLDQQSDLMPLSDGPIHKIPQGMCIPWWLFFILLSVPFVMQSAKSLGCSEHLASFGKAFQKKYAFYLARRALHKAQDNQDKVQIYMIFSTLISRRLSIALGDITHEYMEQKLQLYLPINLHQEWQQFVHYLVRLVYMATEQSDSDVWQKAFEWLKQLEKGGL